MLNLPLCNPHLVPSQYFEGGHDLVGSVCVGSLTGHEVNEGLEIDQSQPVGVHDAHDAGKLCLSLGTTQRS